MSNDARRQSNEIEELIRRKSGSCSSPKRDIGPESRVGLPSASASAVQTRSTCASVIEVKNGSARERSETRSAIGNSPPTKPNRSRYGGSRWMQGR